MNRGSHAGGGFVFTTSWLEGQILVNNRSFAKDNGVRLSADNGHTFHDTHGFFAGSHADNGIFVGPGAEVWQFKTPELNLDNSASEFRFAVFYRVQATGEVFWDNNFGQDYRISKATGRRSGSSGRASESDSAPTGLDEPQVQRHLRDML